MRRRYCCCNSACEGGGPCRRRLWQPGGKRERQEALSLQPAPLARRKIDGQIAAGEDPYELRVEQRQKPKKKAAKRRN